MATGLTLGSFTSKYHWILVSICVRDVLISKVSVAMMKKLPKSGCQFHTGGIDRFSCFSMEKDQKTDEVLTSTIHQSSEIVGDRWSSKCFEAQYWKKTQGRVDRGKSPPTMIRCCKPFVLYQIIHLYSHGLPNVLILWHLHCTCTPCTNKHARKPSISPGEIAGKYMQYLKRPH